MPQTSGLSSLDVTALGDNETEKKIALGVDKLKFSSELRFRK